MIEKPGGVKRNPVVVVGVADFQATISPWFISTIAAIFLNNRRYPGVSTGALYGNAGADFIA